jgi:SAM-dependent methyltransferase
MNMTNVTSDRSRAALSYKVAFAARHPGQIPPYLRRVCVDAYLRAKTGDHVSYYRRIMKYKAAAHGVEVAVGSRSYQQWLEFGQMQFDYLVRHGLMPSDRVLEIGCGNLRAGRLLIDYLDNGNYYGTDISGEILTSALKVLSGAGLQDKLPRLTLTQDLTFDFLPDGHFTVIHANSVFTHCPLELIDECLANVGRIMAPGGFFDFTFYAHDGGGYQIHREDFYYHPDTLLALARRHGLDAHLLDDWHDPWDHQPKIRITHRAAARPPAATPVRS